MLKVAGIASYPVAIYSGDPFYVRESWPSPQQFNHAIIAISVSDTTPRAASVEHPALGRLLFFDPTDPDTSVGDLPQQLQGSFALIAAGEKGGLVRIPTIPPDTDELQRQTDLVLSPDGTIEATMEENSIGQAELSESAPRSEEHTSELQSLAYLVCRLLLEKKKNMN